ncbi:LysR family transcriptional regulator [Devosia ginsengisoli]|uniref:LysR family transcriptional regulator n=1 Tax=Devosia ginsengisoli TaxID=400770 RepID=UPI0026EA957A|nr:LysR family transcriptional regulator [Devosia ginsengisoli]MCR6673301.1 LysR family transcriptional regulator [Devosia ginsengisoli]
MDIALAKTFLEIAETGSFVAAAGRLNVTQTAVSARVHALEDQLGRRLFIRNKSGARLTPAGERFVRHATTLVQVWDRARQQVGLPQGRVDIASVGAEISLWNPVLADWLVWMKHEAPDIALRAEVDTPSRLQEAVHSGALDMAVLYDPPPQGGNSVVELLTEEKLVMVTTSPDGERGPPEDYVQIDWGASFQTSHQAAFPEISSPGVLISHGPLALLYLTRVGGAGYFRLSAVQPFLESGRLHRVADAPEFSYSVHMVYSSRAETGLIDRMRRGFRSSTP